MNARPIEILLVEDNPADARLMLEALRECKVTSNLHVARDGAEALERLRLPRVPLPDLVLLDLNLPRKNGREVLQEMKSDAALASIPVVILTGSRAERDMVQSYELRANCYVTKPIDLAQFVDVVKAVGDFWVSIAKLPPRAGG